MSATPLVGPWATSDLMSSLFISWPRADLSLMTLDRAGLAVEAQAVRTTVVRPGPTELFRSVAAIRRIVRAREIELLYLHSSGWPLAFEAASFAAGRPLVVHFMDDWPELLGHRSGVKAAVAPMLARGLARRASSRIAISPSMADVMSLRYGRDFHVVHSGAAPNEHGDARADDRHRTVDDESETVVFYSGGSASEQNLGTLFAVGEAVQALREQGRAIIFELATTGLDAGSVRRFEGLGVRLLERVSRPVYLARLRSADLLVLPYGFSPEAERFVAHSQPNKLPELLAAGPPILVIGPPSLAVVARAIDEGWAAVVTLDDTNAMGQAIVQSIDRSEPASRRKSRQAILARDHDLSSIRNRFEQILSSAAYGRG